MPFVNAGHWSRLPCMVLRTVMVCYGTSRYLLSLLGLGPNYCVFWHQGEQPYLESNAKRKLFTLACSVGLRVDAHFDFGGRAEVLDGTCCYHFDFAGSSFFVFGFLF